MAEESASAVCKELLRLTEAAGAAGGEEDNGNRKHGGLGYMLVALFHREVNRYGAFSKVTAVAIDEYGGDLGNDGEGDLLRRFAADIEACRGMQPGEACRINDAVTV